MFYILSLISFILVFIPKVVSFYILLTVLFTRRSKIRLDPLLDKNQSVATVYDDDTRRKLVMRAYTFSEFRSQGTCIDYINYEVYKTEFITALYKLLVQDIPMLIIQSIYISQTQCGRTNFNTMIYLSITTTILSIFSGFCYKAFIFAYKHKRLQHYKNCVTLNLGNDTIDHFGFKNVETMLPFNKNLQILQF